MDHIRIDEGVKRGPRKKPLNPAANIKLRDPKTGRALAVIPKDLKPEEVIDRYLADERTADIAASYGVARSRLNQWLLEHAEEPWKRAQIARAITLRDQAEDDVGCAADPLALGRAREMLKSAQWQLERLCARLFGQQTHVTIEHVGDLGERLRRAKERVIEGECVAVASNPALPQVADSVDDAEQQDAP